MQSNGGNVMSEPSAEELAPFVQGALQGYMVAMLWTGTDTDENGDTVQLDDEYDCGDFAESALHAMREDVQDFVYSQWSDVQGMNPEQVGHDFLLTRNHHGAGFWDRGLGDVGDRLTDACRPYGSSDAYVGDDGMVYVG
jgi:hypothetical protein